MHLFVLRIKEALAEELHPCKCFVLQYIARRCIVFRMTKHMKGIAAEVRAAAARKGLSQADLGIVLSLGRLAVSRRLNGHQDFTVDELFKLSTALDVDIADLIKAGDEAA